MGRRGVGRDDGGPESRDRRGDRRGAAVGRRGRRARRRRRPQGLRRVGRQDAQGPDGAAAQARRRDRRERRGADAARVAERRQADVDRRRRDAVLRRQPALLRRRRPHARGQGRRRVRRGLHVDHPARAARDRRRDHAVELPADDGDLEARAGARRRQRPDPEAGRADAADDAPLRRARAGVPAAGRAAGRHRRRRSGGGRARPPSGDPARLADRLGRDGQADRGRRGADEPQARPPRARRQGADGRARRRRPGHGRRGDQDRRLLELGPGLHRLVADPRPREGLRRRHVRDGQDARGDEGRRPGRGRRRRHGPGDLEGAAGARARLPRAGGRGRRRRSSPAASRSATAASSSSRPSSPTSPRTPRSSRTRSSGRS